MPPTIPPRWRRIVTEMTHAPDACYAYELSEDCTMHKNLEVHHPIPSHGDEDLFFDPDNRELKKANEILRLA